MPDKTLYIEIFQPFAQYRNPFTFYYAQTYPLPPKSTIIGMLQNATDRFYDPDFWNLKVSVHGGFESYFWNYQQLIKGDVGLKRMGGEPHLWNQGRPLYGSGLKSQRTPIYQQELFNGRLYIFIRGEEELIDKIKDALERPKKVLSLGRSEDVIFIRDVKEDSEFEKKDEKKANKSIWITYPTYIIHRKEERKSKKEFPIENRQYPVYSMPIKVVFENDGKPVRNKAEITKKTERKPEFATVIHAPYKSAIYLREPVMVEKIKVNGRAFKMAGEWGWI